MGRILTPQEAEKLKSMALYWEEVKQRGETGPLWVELHQVHAMLGVRVLFIISAYLQLKEQVRVHRQVGDEAELEVLRLQSLKGRIDILQQQIAQLQKQVLSLQKNVGFGP